MDWWAWFEMLLPYVLGLIFVAGIVWSEVRSRNQRRTLEAQAQASEQRYLAWLKQTRPCPTCAGDGRVALAPAEARE